LHSSFGKPGSAPTRKKPMVGENSIGILLAWRSFQAAISRSASSSTPARRFVLCGLAVVVVQLAAVKAHGFRYAGARPVKSDARWSASGERQSRSAELTMLHHIADR
jgi:hypothetical protein